VNEAFLTICKEIKEKITLTPETDNDLIKLSSGKAIAKNNGKDGKTCC